MSNSISRFNNQVAVPAPIRQIYDYLSVIPVKPGTRVLVPFGKRTVVGVVISNCQPNTAHKLKSIKQVLDPNPSIDKEMLTLLLWAEKYYHHPVGEVLNAALPTRLRTARQLDSPFKETIYRCIPGLNSEIVKKALCRSPRQKSVYNTLSISNWLSIDQIRKRLSETESTEWSGLKGYLDALQSKSLIESRIQIPEISNHVTRSVRTNLTSEQSVAINSITSFGQCYAAFLLHGITGSGKTEVYLSIVESCINQAKQSLVLVPEIALTPQLVARFTERFGQGVCMVHSGLTDQQRYKSWWRARSGDATVVLGTRSAIFIPLKNPGVIIVDEEHDLSYKQQDGFRYHARDLAIMRARRCNIPAILGSATPSMESMRNVESSKYHLLTLKQRIGAARLPDIQLIDTRVFPLRDGLSAPLLEAISSGLKQQQQTILYINRRGFAPIAQCGNCRWRACCDRCDAYLTFHKKTDTYRCHHCSKITKAVVHCPECKQAIFFAGVGTQRVEKALAEQFPNARISRFDRDELTTQNQLEQALDRINQGATDIVIGTQLISKGHDFPRVTLVGIINPDQGLYSSDFRAPEILFQQLVQVAGRAGRSDRPGSVIIQTAYPDNLYLDLVRNHDFDSFYTNCAMERKSVQLPPYGNLALWRAESTNQHASLAFLQFINQIGEKLLKAKKLNGINIMDPISSPMEKLAGRYRAQLLVKSRDRSPLHDLLTDWLAEVDHSRESRKVRWSIDIDPMEMF